MHTFGYARPQSLPEAVALIAENGEQASLLAGGTDLTVGLRHGTTTPRFVIDVKRLRDLPPAIVATEARVRISATTVLTDLVGHDAVRRHFPSLVEAADVVGSIQIRNRATLAGNICNASPAADTVPVLVVLGASVTVFGPGGEREVPVVDFILGNRRTDLGQGELVIAVNIPVPTRPIGTAFARMTRRRGVDLATINLCCRTDEDGTTTFAYGAVSPKPLLVQDTSGILADPAASAHAKSAALDALLAQAAPITDVRASKEYRLAMLRVLSRRTLYRATEALATRRRNG